MATLQWVIICDKAIIEGESNALSLIGIAERVQIGSALGPDGPKPPPHGTPIPYPFSVVQLWARSKAQSPERVFSRLDMHLPNGRRFARVTSAVNLEAAGQCRVISRSAGIPFHGPGLYEARVYLSKDEKRWRLAGRTAFEVIIDGSGPPA